MSHGVYNTCNNPLGESKYVSADVQVAGSKTLSATSRQCQKAQKPISACLFTWAHDENILQPGILHIFNPSSWLHSKFLASQGYPQHCLQYIENINKEVLSEMLKGLGISETLKGLGRQLGRKNACRRHVTCYCLHSFLKEAGVYFRSF